MSDIKADEVGGSVTPEPVHLITLEWDRRSGEPPHAECTCGEFKTEPTTNMLKLGLEAFKHRDITGHILREHKE